MTEPTKEQMLVEWLNDRLGLVYLGLTQLSESSGYWETYYEDEIEPLESIRALIESSGDKASGDGVVFHAWKDGKWLGVVADPALSDRIFIGHTQSHLQEGEKVVCKICGRTAEEITGQPAHSPAPTIKKDLTVGVEEAIKWLDSLSNMNYPYCRIADENEEIIAVIKSALRPKVVTREWIRKRADWAGCLGVTDVAGILRELGHEISEGGMG